MLTTLMLSFGVPMLLGGWKPLGFVLPPPSLVRNGTPRSTATTPPLLRERPNATLVIR